jgi:hypothetical protein
MYKINRREWVRVGCEKKKLKAFMAIECEICEKDVMSSCVRQIPIEREICEKNTRRGRLWNVGLYSI